MSKIALLLPTRKRPQNLVRLLESVASTADNPENIIVSVYIDDDDTSYDHLIFEGPVRVVITRGPRIILSQMWNKAYEAVKDEAEYFWHGGDDIIFRSNGWDTLVKDAIDSHRKKIAFVWGNDHSPESERNVFGTHGFVHKNWTDTLGRFVPPYYSSDYNDTHFNDLANALNVAHYLHDVHTEHMHYSLGKAEIDETTSDRLERHAKDRPDLIYNSPAMCKEREEDAEKLRKFKDA